MKRLQGKNILITGASQGLGRQLALSFAQQGAAGIAIVARDQQTLDAVKQEVEQVVPTGGVVAIAAVE
ncbi:MAG: SDR family NAD(P)-dependent oxidoreductase [Cyanobacteria bacterium P01_A01_bin.123]